MVRTTLTDNTEVVPHIWRIMQLVYEAKGERYGERREQDDRNHRCDRINQPGRDALDPLNS